MSRPSLSLPWENGSKRNKIIKPDILIGSQFIVEYDGWFYHKDLVEEDLAKTKALLKAGYSVIRIRNKEFLDSFLDILKDESYFEIDYRKERNIDNSLLDTLAAITNTYNA